LQKSLDANSWQSHSHKQLHSDNSDTDKIKESKQRVNHDAIAKLERDWDLKAETWWDVGLDWTFEVVIQKEGIKWGYVEEIWVKRRG